MESARRLLKGLLVCAVLIASAAADNGGASQEEIEQAVRSSVPEGHNVKIPQTDGTPIRYERASASCGADKDAMPHVDPRLNYSSLLKPAFHLTPPTGGWMNDPNGMLQMQPGGPVHVFYQLNPFQPKWGSPWWGHFITDDLAHWKEVAAALKPDQWYDRDGVFSGSAALAPGQAPQLLYTGVMNFSQYGFYYQQQAAAVPADPSDPLLIEWTKLDTNPLPGMDIPPGSTNAQFRDPITPWPLARNQPDVKGLIAAIKQHGMQNISIDTSPNGNGGSTLWATAVGAQDDCIGAASLYLSDDDFKTWTWAGSLYSQLAQNFTYAQSCLATPGGSNVPVGSRGYGGSCDQFGQTCRMWECPDYFSVGSGVSVIKYSDQVTGRIPVSRDFYVLGQDQYLNWSSAMYQDRHDAFSAVMDGKPFEPRVVDYGAVYASKSFNTENDTRRLWLGWVYEESWNCTSSCGDGTAFIMNYTKWQGAQTLVREITYDPAAQTLLWNPVPETNLLRQATLANRTVMMYDVDALPSAAAAGGKPPMVIAEVLADERSTAGRNSSSGGSGMNSGNSSNGSPSGRRQMEIRATFDLTLDSSMTAGGGSNGDELPFIVGVRVGHGGGGKYTDVLLRANTTGMWSGTSSRRKLQHASRALLQGSSSSASSTTPTVKHMLVQVDRSHTGGMTQSRRQSGPVYLPRGGVAGNNLTLVIYVDRSMLEVYAMGRRATITSRIYPIPRLPEPTSASCNATNSTTDSSTGPASATDSSNSGNSSTSNDADTTLFSEDQLGAWGVSVFGAWAGGAVKAHLDVYEMGSCWSDMDATRGFSG